MENFKQQYIRETAKIIQDMGQRLQVLVKLQYFRSKLVSNYRHLCFFQITIGNQHCDCLFTQILLSPPIESLR